MWFHVRLKSQTWRHFKISGAWLSGSRAMKCTTTKLTKLNGGIYIFNLFVFLFVFAMVSSISTGWRVFVGTNEAHFRWDDLACFLPPSALWHHLYNVQDMDHPRSNCSCMKMLFFFLFIELYFSPLRTISFHCSVFDTFVCLVKKIYVIYACHIKRNNEIRLCNNDKIQTSKYEIKSIIHITSWFLLLRNCFFTLLYFTSNGLNRTRRYFCMN